MSQVFIYQFVGKREGCTPWCTLGDAPCIAGAHPPILAVCLGRYLLLSTFAPTVLTGLVLVALVYLPFAFHCLVAPSRRAEWSTFNCFSCLSLAGGAHAAELLPVRANIAGIINNKFVLLRSSLEIGDESNLLGFSWKGTRIDYCTLTNITTLFYCVFHTCSPRLIIKILKLCA